MNSVVNVGPQVAAVEAARSAVMDILNTREDQETKRMALQMIGKVASVENVTISGCTIYGAPEPRRKK